MKDVTFLVSSCDKYEDAWHPFFEMLRIYGVPADYPMVLNTETKTFSSDHYRVRVINTPGKATWSQRMRNVLEHIDTDFVFLLLEDYFLKAPFDPERFESVLEYMRTHPDVGFVDIAPWYCDSLAQQQALQAQHVHTPDSFTLRRNEKFNICVVPSVYRRDVFLSLLRDHEDVWEYEYYAGFRANKYGIQVVRYNTHTPTIYEYDFHVWSGMGITRGQWLPKNVEFFARHNISVPFDRLGILDVASLQEIKQMPKTPKVLLRTLRRKLRVAWNRPKSKK